MPTNFQGGIVASVKISSTGYAFDKFELTEKTNIAKVTNFLGGGYQQTVPGVYSADLTTSGPYDIGNMGAMVPGDTISLILTFVSGTAVTVPFMVVDIKFTSDINDAQRISITWTSNGSFTLGPY
jgi:hypothetical protein